jgi:two-component system chemotaxis response regulator CheB
MTIAVVLSGTGRDGSSGVQAVKRMGGTVIAQDRATSEFYGMPAAAIDTGDVDYVLPVDQIAETLVLLVQQVPER